MFYELKKHLAVKHNVLLLYFIEVIKEIKALVDCIEKLPSK